MGSNRKSEVEASCSKSNKDLGLWKPEDLVGLNRQQLDDLQKNIAKSINNIRRAKMNIVLALSESSDTHPPTSSSDTVSYHSEQSSARLSIHSSEEPHSDAGCRGSNDVLEFVGSKPPGFLPTGETLSSMSSFSADPPSLGSRFSPEPPYVPTSGTFF